MGRSGKTVHSQPYIRSFVFRSSITSPLYLSEAERRVIFLLATESVNSLPVSAPAHETWFIAFFCLVLFYTAHADDPMQEVSGIGYSLSKVTKASIRPPSLPGVHTLLLLFSPEQKTTWLSFQCCEKKNANTKTLNAFLQPIDTRALFQQKNWSNSVVFTEKTRHKNQKSHVPTWEYWEE